MRIFCQRKRVLNVLRSIVACRHRRPCNLIMPVYDYNSTVASRLTGGSGVTTAPADPATQGEGPRGSGYPCANPQNFDSDYIHMTQQIT